jgi:alpha-galactosidase
MWSLLAAPLILGCDLTKLDAFTKALITNPEVIAVDQDPLGRAATRLFSTGSGQEVWTRPLSDGSTAVGLMNRGRSAQEISVSWKQLGFRGAPKVRDLWMRKEFQSGIDGLRVKVPGHGAKLFKMHL